MRSCLSSSWNEIIDCHLLNAIFFEDLQGILKWNFFDLWLQFFFDNMIENFDGLIDN